MKAQLKDSLSGARRKAFTPVLAKLDAVSDHLDAIDTRIDALFRRLDEVERVAQSSGGRVSTVGERYQGLTESVGRLAGRVEELERLMGAVERR